MADELRGRLEIKKELLNVELRIDRALESTSLTQLQINKYVDEQKKKSIALGRELRQANVDRLKGFAREENSLKSMSSMYGDLSKTDAKRIKLQVNSNSLTTEQSVAISRIAEINRDISQLSNTDTRQNAALTSEYDVQSNILDGISIENKNIVDNLKHQNNLAKQHASLSEGQKQQLQSQLEAYTAIKKSINGVLDTARLLTNTVGGLLGGALIGAGVAGKKLLSTAQDLGGSLTSTTNIATTLFGTVFKDAIGVTKSLSKEFGGLNDLTLKTQLNANLISENLGIGSGEAASLIGNFSRLNEGSNDTALNLIQSTKELALQNGLVPADVMADLASSTEEFAVFGKQGGINISEAVVAANKLGVSMSTLTNVTDSLLDFETSINAELELGAMLGKNINLDRARALSFEGDIGGAVKETLSSLGGIDTFNKMDVIAKRKAASLLGISVSEFQKMANNAGKLNKDGSIQLSQFDQLTNLAKGFGSQLLSGSQALGGMAMASGQLNMGFKGMGTSIGGVIKGTGKLLSNILQMTAGSVVNKLKAVGGFLATKTKVGRGVGSVKNKLMKGVKDKFSKSITPDIDSSAGSNGGTSMMDKLSKVNMNAVLKGAAALVIVAGAVFIFGKAVQEFMKVSWEAVGKAVVSMLALVGAVALLGVIMSSGVGAIAILAGAAAMLIVASSVMVLGNALQSIGTGFKMLGEGITTLVPNLTGVGGAISSMVTFIPAIVALSAALMLLSSSLIAVGLAGMLSLPGLMAVAAVGTIAMGVGSLLGIDGESENGSGSDNSLLNEIKGLRNDLNSGKVGVYMDGERVTAAISKVVSKVGSNSYAI